MTEPVVASGLAALGVVCGVAAVASAVERPAAWRGVIGRRSVPPAWWAPVLIVAAVAFPRPVGVAAPVAALVVVVGRRLATVRRAATRRYAIDREVPQLLDLLAAASSAGLAAQAGFRAAVGTLRGPLGDELRECLAAVDLGAAWRPQLAQVTDRLDVPELRRTLAILERTATLGTSLAEATRELAADVRQARRASVAERARAAPVKMLFPLVFLILPAFLLLTVVPVLLTTVRSIR